MNRNLLYDVKKSNMQSNQILYQNNTPDYKTQLNDLRTILRQKETDIIRYKSQIDDLKSKIKQLESQIKMNRQSKLIEQQEKVEQFSEIPFILQNTKLKQENEKMVKEIFVINGQRNEIQIINRQFKIQIQNQRKRIRQLEILEKMRSERFEQEVKLIKPVVIKLDEDKQLREGNLILINFLRESMTDIIFVIFINSANLSEKRKVNSLIIFKNNINQLRKSQRNGFVMGCHLYQKFKKLIKIYHTDYGKLDPEKSNNGFRDTFNTWLEASLIDVISKSKLKPKKDKKQDEQLYLFRLLALFYRIKYPLKGQKYTVDADLKIRLESKICKALYLLLVNVNQNNN